MKPFQVAVWDEKSRVSVDDLMKALPRMTLEQAQKAMAKVERELVDSTVWRNDVYQVVERLIPAGEHGLGNIPVVHLSIKRIDREPIHDWRDLQSIKNELVGAECEAIELYPAESRCVDTANQYHLWCFKDPTQRVPVGWFEGMLKTEVSVGQSKQRPFDSK